MRSKMNQNLKELTPEEIVKELDKYIIGQDRAKRSVAIALRNRWRRQQVTGPLRDEIMPNNIILIGPTGVGKTEISRRRRSSHPLRTGIRAWPSPRLPDSSWHRRFRISRHTRPARYR